MNRFHGLYTATLSPFDRSDALDESLLARHFADVAAVPGMKGVLCNGHAGENFLLTRDEMRRVVEIAARTIGGRCVIAAGVHAEATREAVRIAEDAEAAGADAVVVFPPFSWAVSTDADAILHHHEAIRRSVRLPMFLYMTSTASGRMNYPAPILERLLGIEDIVGIKEGSWDLNAYERTRALVARTAPHVAVLASADEGLYPGFAVGSEGSMVSLAVIAGDEIVALARAVAADDHDTARRLHARLQPLAGAIYHRSPPGRATARLKAAMVLLGRWPDARTRRPIGPLPPDELALLRDALEAAGLATVHAAS